MWQWQSLSCSGCNSPWHTFLAHWQVTCHLDLDLHLNRFQERSKPGPGFQASKDGRPFKRGHQVLFICMGQPWQLYIRGITSAYKNTLLNSICNLHENDDTWPFRCWLWFSLWKYHHQICIFGIWNPSQNKIIRQENLDRGHFLLLKALKNSFGPHYFVAIFYS